MGGGGAHRGHEQEQEGRDSHYLRQRKHNVMFRSGSKKESRVEDDYGYLEARSTVILGNERRDIWFGFIASCMDRQRF